MTEDINLSSVSSAKAVYNAISAGPANIGCDWTGLAIVEVAGLHNSLLSQFSRRSGLTVQQGSPDSLRVPYVKQADSDALEEAAWQWMAGCEERDLAETGEKVVRAVQTIRVGEGEGMKSIIQAALHADPYHHNSHRFASCCLEVVCRGASRICRHNHRHSFELCIGSS